MKNIKVDGGWLVESDCLSFMKRLKPNSIDLVVGSPPYEKARLYLEGGKDLGIARDTEEWVAWMVEVVEVSLRVSRGLVAFVVGHGTNARRWTGAPALLEADLIRKGVCLRRTAYYKRNGIMGSGGNDWLRADVERIVCATNNDGPLPWSDNTACGRPPEFKAGGPPTHRNKNGVRANSPKSTYAPIEQRRNLGSHRARKKNPPYQYTPPEKSNPGDVIDCGVIGSINMGSKIVHENEAPFPEKLADFFVRSFCPPGGVVLDPFGGSGTTAAVAVKSGRKFISVDLRASQIAIMKRRVNQAHRQKGFFQS